MLKIKTTSKFKKDYKLAKKRGCDMRRLEAAVSILAAGKPLPEKCRDHVLSGKYKNFHECHIEPDWLLIYEIKREELVLTLTRTGSHSDLF